MSSSRNITYKQPAAYQRSFSKDTQRATKSSFPPLEASKQHSSMSHHFGQLPESDLFAALLFDRQRAYQRAPSTLPTTRRPPAAQVKEITYHKKTQSHDASRKGGLKPHVHLVYEGTHTDDESDAFMLGFRDKAAVSKIRGRSTRKGTTATKSEGKATADKPKKRPATARATSARIAKSQKTEANCKRKLDDRNSVRNGMGSPMKTPLPADVDVIIISSDEEEGAKTRRAPRREVTPDDIKLESEAIVAQPRTEATPQAPTRIPLGILASNDEWDFGSLDPEPSLSLSKHQSELARVGAAHEQEVQSLREELGTAKAKIEQVTQLYDRDEKDRELERVRTERKANNRYNDVLRELDSMERKLKRTETERDQSRIEVDNEKVKCEEPSKELQKEKDEHKILVQDATKKKEASIETLNASLRDENTRLRNEVESLKSAATAASSSLPAFANPTTTSQSIFPLSPISPTTSTFHTPSIRNRLILSPAPSSISSEEERKMENIRKTYTTVKRRCDNIQFAASKLVGCTRSMDLSSFGEFGGYLKQLRSVLEDNGQNKVETHNNRVEMVRESETEDWK